MTTLKFLKCRNITFILLRCFEGDPLDFCAAKGCFLFITSLSKLNVNVEQSSYTFFLISFVEG